MFGGCIGIDLGADGGDDRHGHVHNVGLMALCLGLPTRFIQSPRFILSFEIHGLLIDLAPALFGLFALDALSLELGALFGRAFGDRLFRGDAGLVTAGRAQIAASVQRLTALLTDFLRFRRFLLLEADGSYRTGARESNGSDDRE